MMPLLTQKMAREFTLVINANRYIKPFKLTRQNYVIALLKRFLNSQPTKDTILLEQGYATTKQERLTPSIYTL
jgi:hypothetical protein